MKSYLPVFIIFVLLVSLLGSFQSAQAGPVPWRVLDARQNTVNPALQQALAQLPSGEMLTVIVTLRQQADLSRIQAVNRATRLQGVIQALQATASATQGQLIGLLNSYRSQGLVSSYSAFWIFNGFSVTASPEVITALSQEPDVLSITPDDLQIVPASGPAEPNLALIGAPSLWDAGDTGQGVVVANMDTGVDLNHPDLSTRWRGGSNSWYDPYGQHPSTPTDLNGHGTQTMGVMVGGDAGGTSIGVAPGAQWIAVKMFNDSDSSTATAIHLGYQWLLDPDGNPNTADAPNVINNSWDFPNPGCNLDFEPDLEALRAAGILPVFAAGNGGPSSNTSFSPANNPAAFAVGAVDNTDQLYPYSSRGPSSCVDYTGPFPKLVAPGVNIRTSELYGLYNTETGTSLAAPHVAGGLALLLSAYPNLDAGMQEQSLIHSAVDLGASGPDEAYGYGRLDLVPALDWASTAPTSTPVPTFTPTATSTPSPTPLPNINVALNQPVTVSSSSDSSHDGSKAVDGNLSTLWQTAKVKGKNGPATEWIDVDLGSSQAVSQVVLAWSTYYATVYSIQTSNDNSSWSTVFSTSNGHGGTQTLTFNTVQVRYVRLLSSAWSSGSNRNWLNELEVYPQAGSTASPTDTPTVTPSPTPTATSTPSPTATSGSGGSSNSVHVGDLAASATSSGSRWSATVVVTVHDASETLMPGVTVSGSWSNGASGSSSCTTDASGTCSLSKNNLKNNVGSVTLTVTDLAASLTYDASANHDPDTDSNGTTILVAKP